MKNKRKETVLPANIALGEVTLVSCKIKVWSSGGSRDRSWDGPVGEKMNQKKLRETSYSEGLKGINMFSNILRVR